MNLVMRAVMMGMMLVGVGRAAEQMPAPRSPWAGVEDFNSGWLYGEISTPTIPPAGKLGFVPVTLPHTWNAVDTMTGKSYRRGISWYRKSLAVTEADVARRLFLRFGAAGQEAAVFVNGRAAGEHLGGYSAFTVELTGWVREGDNQIDVRVSNDKNKQIVPTSDGLFNIFGGLYRRAELIRAPRICLSRTTSGGPGVRVWSESVGEDKADLHVRAMIDSDGEDASGYAVLVELADPAGAVVSSGEGRSGDFTLPDVVSPKLWSPEHPVLYTLTVKLMKDGKETDRATVRHGFRTFEFTADRGFFLNGRPYHLRGVNRHQDLGGSGNAVPLAHHWNDVRMMKELGVNWLRLAHYQQDDYMLQLCDELGIMVWEEIPLVRATTPGPEFERNTQAMLGDMIEQHFNHPAILLWGMGNEIWFTKDKRSRDGRATFFPMIERLHERIHREDPVRKSVIVCGDANYYSTMKIMSIPDVIGYNLYLGWYGGRVTNLTARIEALHKMDPTKPLIVSEFGSGCEIGLHKETPKAFDQSEEYQVFFLESYLKQMDAIPWLAGYNWWNFADFSWAQSSTPKFRNNKGFVTLDRKGKKDSFYCLKSHWSQEPVLYLCSPSFTNRTEGAVKQYRVFTNLDSVELFHQGKSLGTQATNFVWSVTLQPGPNRLLAKGARGETRLEHGFTVTYTKPAGLFSRKPKTGPVTAEPPPSAAEANPFKVIKE